MLEVRPLLLLAIPGQLMLLAGGILTWLAGFGWVAGLPLASALVTMAGLAAALWQRRGWTMAATLALLAAAAGLATAVWQAFVHLPPHAGLASAMLVTVLASGVFGPAVAALGLALRAGRRGERAARPV